MIEHGTSEQIAGSAATPEVNKSFMGWLADWLQGLAEADDTSDGLPDSHAGVVSDDLHRDPDRHDEDLRFSAFMTGPLY